jgi:hypothetical protein
MSISASFVHGAPAINNFAVTNGTHTSPAPAPEGMSKSSTDAGTRPAVVALKSDPVLAPAGGFANLIGQAAKLPSKTNSTDRFFKLRRVATTGVVALPAYLAGAVDHVRHAAMGLKSAGPRRFSDCSKFAARASKIADPLLKIR